MQKDWALSGDQCWLQVLQFSVHLIDLLSVLIGCNGFTRIQRAVVDGSRPPNSDRGFLLVQLWLSGVLWSFFSVQPHSWSSLVVIQNQLIVTCHNPIEKWFVVVAWKKRR